MNSSKTNFDIKPLEIFLSQFSKGDEQVEKKLRSELVMELGIIQSKLQVDMEGAKWQSIIYSVSRLKSLFQIIGLNTILEEINTFPDVNVDILNRLQKEDVVEKIIKLISVLIAQISK
jgi:hypothetical protein